MICPVCGSSNIHRVRKSSLRDSDLVLYVCYSCDHFFDREEVRDFNGEVSE